jgi:DNA-binding Lrp family transcriptional regulator
MSHLQPTQDEQIIAELERDWQRYDSDIASILGVSAKEVERLRRKTFTPHYTPYVKRRLAIEADLRATPDLTDQELAVKHHCSTITVAKYRAGLGLPKSKNKVRKISEGTHKARAMLELDPMLTDIHISRECGISFAHVARQRDVLGIPRSPQSNRMASRVRGDYDYTRIDADINSNDFTYRVIAIRNEVPYERVTQRAQQLGIKKRQRMSPEKYQKILDLLGQENRMTDKKIAVTLGVSSVYVVSEIRRKAGIPRLQPGVVKREASNQAMTLLSEPERKSLSQIARETGLTVTTVRKIRNRMIDSLKGASE